MKRWIRNLFAKPRPQVRRPQLNLLSLEDRITPADFRDVGGLRFFTPDGTFTPSGAASTISTNVQVGLTPAAKVAFVPLLDLPGGVTVATSPVSARVNASVRVGGVTFTGNNLAFGFDTPNSKFTLSGTAAFSAGGVSISGNFGSAASGTPGLVIQNGKVQSVDVGVTSSFSFGGVSFQSSDLRFKLDTASGNRFALSGGAAASFQGAGSTVNVATRFGDSVQKPGLVVVNGQLTDLAVGITGNFKVAGLEAAANDLTFRYKAVDQSFGLTGSVRISTAPVSGGRRVLDNFGVMLGQGVGSTATPGLLVRGGSLERLDFTLNGAINLASLSVMPSNLRVNYARDTNLLQITGGLNVSLGAQFNASADLNNGGLVINTNTGAVQLNGFRIALNDTRLGPVTVRSAFVSYRSNGNGGFDLSGAAVVDLPAGITVDGGFMFANGTIDRIRFEISKSPGLQVPGTPVFITRLSADLMNLSTPSQLRLMGTATFTGGGSFRLGGRDVSLIQGTVAITLDLPNSRIMLDGAMSLIGTAIPLASAQVIIQFNPNSPGFVQSVRGFAQVNLFFGFVTGRVDLNLMATGDATYTFSGSVQIPSFTIPRVFIPSFEVFPPISFGLLGTTPAVYSPEITLIDATRTPRIELGTASVTLRLSASNPQSSSFTFSGTLLSFITANFRVSFDGNVSVQGGVDVPLLGKANLPAINFNIGQLFPNIAPPLPPPPPPPAAPSGYAPSVRITSVTRTSNGRGAVVRFQASTIDTPSGVVRFTYGDGRSVASVNLASPGVNQTYDRNTGVGTFTIADVVADGRSTPVRPIGDTFTLTGTIQDRFASGRSDAFGPVQLAPLGYAPTVQIMGTARQPDGRLRIDFQANSLDAAASIQFDNDTPGPALGNFRFPTSFVGRVDLNQLPAGATYDPATGRGSVIVSDPPDTIRAGVPFRLTATITDFFTTGRSAPTAPIPTIITLALTVVAPNTLTLRDLGPSQPFLNAGQRYSISDPLQNAATSVVRLVIRTETAAVTFRPVTPLPPSIVIESQGQNNGRYLRVRGTVADVNVLTRQLELTRTSLAASELRFYVARVNDLDTSFAPDKFISIPAADRLTATLPPFHRPSIEPNGPPVLAFARTGAGTTIRSDAGSIVQAVASLGERPGTPFGSDKLALTLPAGSPLTVSRSRLRDTLYITGPGTAADYQAAINLITFTAVGPTGEIPASLYLADSAGNTNVTEFVLSVFRPFTAAQTAETTPPALTPSPAEGLFLATGTPSPFDGTGPSALFPDLVAGNDTGSPVTSATVAFTGFFDSTSDRLAFTPVGGITGAFDAASGVLTLTAGPSSTLDDFQATLRSVTFDSLRKNAMLAPRQITATLFTATESSPPEFGTVVLAMEAPVVPPIMTGTTDMLTMPVGGSAITMFADMTMTDPDAALPAPSFILGEFLMGSTMTRGTMQIVNHVPGEDFLTFTSTGSLTGKFNEETGELSFFGQGTMAEWQQVMKSVQYENRNAAPTAGDRMIVMTMDDGSASGNPPTIGRTVRVMPDNRTITRTAGEVNAIDVAVGAASTSLGLTDLAYAPRPGEPELIFTITSAPGDGQGTVQLADGTTAVAGQDVTLDQLRGATFVAAAQQPAGSVPFTFRVAGVNSVTRQLSDGITETLAIRTPNIAPVAVADAFTVQSDTPFALSPIGNDTDANGELLLVDTFTQPTHGTLSTDDGITFTFTPNPGFTGTDAFTYTVRDATGATAASTVNLTITPSARTANRVGANQFATAVDGGGTATLMNPDGTPRFTVAPFENFGSGVRVAAADFTGDGVADLVVGTGTGVSTQVKIYDGVSQKELVAFAPFEATFTGGVFLAAGDLDSDNVPELVVTPDNGGGPRVNVYRGTDMVNVISFFGIDDTNFRGGARASIGDVNGDGRGDLLVAAGIGGGPRIAGFDGRSLTGTPTRLFGDFFAFEESLRNGVFLSVGDFDGDGRGEVVAGAGPGGGPRVSIFDSANLLLNQPVRTTDFFAGDTNNRNGIRVAVKNLDSDDRADLVVGSGSTNRVTAYLGSVIAANNSPPEAFAFDAIADITTGVFVG